MKSLSAALAIEGLASLAVLAIVACSGSERSGAEASGGLDGATTTSGGASTGGVSTSATGGTITAGGSSGTAAGTTSGGTTATSGGTASGAGDSSGATGGTTDTGGTATGSGGSATASGGTASASGGESSGGASSGGAGSGGAASGGMGNGGTDAGGTGSTEGTFQATPKPRVLVLTDISNEPDDEESLVRFLVYSNEYDVEGLVATTSTHLETGPREDLIRAELDAYGQVRSNLLQHASGFPTADELAAVTATGQSAYGMAAVGSGKATTGSDLIIDAVDKEDARPVWIAGWGGMNTLAQALTDVRDSRTEAELETFVAKLRVYAISDQDDAGAWLRAQFPQLLYVVSPSDQTADDYYLATWSGISGDEHYDNGPGYELDFVSNAWLTANVRTGHGPLGELYPPWKYIMEGDTPSFLGLIDNGLGSSISPGYGGWGGRYALSKPAGEPREIWTNASDTFEYRPGSTNTSNQATVWRWRADYQLDFAARMDWCIAGSFAQANHPPVPSLNGDSSKAVMHVAAKPGAMISLSAEGTSDPDSDTVSMGWFVYPEAGTLGAGATLSAGQGLTTELSLPRAASGTLHVILDAKDDGDPQLSAYRRVIIDVLP